MTEGAWILFGINGPPPLTRMTATLMSTAITVRTDKARDELAWHRSSTVAPRCRTSSERRGRPKWRVVVARRNVVYSTPVVGRQVNWPNIWLSASSEGEIIGHTIAWTAENHIYMENSPAELPAGWVADPDENAQNKNRYRYDQAIGDVALIAMGDDVTRAHGHFRKHVLLQVHGRVQHPSPTTRRAK